jgi:hypothetical protein
MIPNTPINSAFDFVSTISGNQNQFTNNCIHCTKKNTIPLLKDGTFRKCLDCAKNFWVIQQPTHTIQSQNISYAKPMFETMRPNYLPTNK